MIYFFLILNCNHLHFNIQMYIGIALTRFVLGLHFIEATVFRHEILANFFN